MPFTPFHLGPALLIALVLLPYIDIVAICLGAIIPDIEPAYYLLFTDKGPYHGFFHLRYVSLPGNEALLSNTDQSIPIRIIVSKHLWLMHVVLHTGSYSVSN